LSDYNPADIESKWQKHWVENKTFALEGTPGKKKFYCLDMFPYPSGSGLHIGHPLGYTATDIYSRFKRMNGFEVLHPMGYDAFGLPAEQHAVATGEHPSVITEKNCERFTKQMQTLGLSYDWDRNMATCRPDYYQWTQWIFLKLYNSYFDEEQQKARPIEELPIPAEVQSAGRAAILEYQADYRLAYYADAMVNWCPELGTVLANEEVIDGRSERGGHEVVRKPMAQWMLRITKYSDRLLDELEPIDWPENIKEQQRNWIGKKHGAEIVFQIKGHDDSFTAFTTRPDTLFGVTFFVISPEHPFVEQITTDDRKKDVEEYVTNSLKVSEFDRTLENRTKTGVFTGSYVVNPISKAQVPLYIGDYVLMSYGTGAVMGVPAHDDRDFEFAQKFEIPIRPVIVPKADDEDLLSKVTSGAQSWTKPGIMLPCSDDVAVELALEGKPNTEAAKRITGWLEEHDAGRAVVNYKLRDWLFSRQRYWGEPIPIVHWEDGTKTALNETDLPLVLPQVEEYKPSDSGESPLARAGEWLDVVDPETGMKGRRETNTMPQWAGSCWYYLRFIDPKNDSAAWDPELEKHWMNVDLYVGGAEHAVLHLLYARFWHKVLYDLGEVSTLEPFQKLFNQGMILAHAYKNSRGALIPVDQVTESEDGSAVENSSGEKLEKIVAKMSKSLRNVVNPDDVIKIYGADTLRLYLMFMGPLDQSRIWDSQAITGSHRFLRKAWSFISDYTGGEREFCAEGAESEGVKKALHTAIKRASSDIENLRLNTAISALMEALNTLSGEVVSKHTAEQFVLLLSPLAPHVSEELWSQLGHTETIAYESWPTWNEDILKEDAVTVVIQIKGKKRSTLDVPIDIEEGALKAAVIEHMQNSTYTVSDADRFITVKDKKTGAPKLINVITQ
jgi:leucyl-tRNA synthetase